MKKIIALLLALLTLAGMLAVTGCGKDSEKSISELIIGDWYSHTGAPYRSFSEDGTVTGTNEYSSAYSIEGNMITWDTAGGNTVTVEIWTDGEVLRVATGTGGYFTTRKYYYRSSEGVDAGTGLPKRGTTDTGIFGSWYNGGKLFFKLNEDGTVTGRRDTDGFSFFGDEIVLFKNGFSVDEVADCKLSEDTLTIYYTDTTTGQQGELVLTRKPTESSSNPLAGYTDEQIFLPEEEGSVSSSAEDAE